MQHTGAATAALLFGPRLFGHPLVRSALADTIGDRYLVTLFLDGGNDGLNTVVPVTNGGHTHRQDYQTHRTGNVGGLRIETSELSNTLIGVDPSTGAQLALHPGLAGLMPAWNAGQLAVVQGCGYPDYTLSHEQARTTWQTGNPYGVAALGGTGWLGRHLAANYDLTQIPAASVSGRFARELRQNATNVLGIDQLDYFQFPFDYGYGPSTAADVAAKRLAYQRFYDGAMGNAQATLQALAASGRATLTATDAYAGLTAHYLARSNGAYLSEAYDAIGSAAANDLRDVAKIMYARANPIAGQPPVQARFLQLAQTGFDTHANQGAGSPSSLHYLLHAQWGRALQNFRDDLIDMGLWHKTLVMVWSEFSRRIAQNDSGTDHGSQGPIILAGGSVNGGVYGRHPNIAPAALDSKGNTPYSQLASDPFRSTDARDVYGTILKHWLNMPAAQISPAVLPLDSGPVATQWTVPSFDLGFLA